MEDEKDIYLINHKGATLKVKRGSNFDKYDSNARRLA